MAPVAVSPPTALSNNAIPSKPLPSENDVPTAPESSPPPSDQPETGTDSDNPIPALRAALTSESTSLAIRFRALFSLKHFASLQPPSPTTTIPAIEAIASAFSSPSALLKHELAYCLGQSANLAAVPYLQAVLEDRVEDAMCRHEAAEALGALGDVGSLRLLEEFGGAGEESVVVRETCEIAVDRIRWAIGQRKNPQDREESGRKDGGLVEEGEKEVLKESAFASIDPAPPLPLSKQQQSLYSIEELQARLLDPQLTLFERYRAMFALRDLASPPNLPTAVAAVKALATGFQDPSALFRHEIAFVFGQLSHRASIPALIEVLSNLKEESMVRHEAAEALGSLGDEDGVENVLRGFLEDEEQVVRESVVVALDMAEYERSGEREYAALPVQA